ncbi:MAG TPA: CaiB/BaiF CoA-transferase family protein [Pseudonocardiaceae bacterium]|jgi:crotonobetainyl-CoA:carnitine CoA-transferase CaiB-like acyl-CoA transferase|nr:CaiB/BaiF CoA-transferase family protein [Pseudonocardiaceae bacterium]
MRQPLRGVLVVALEQAVAAPLATRQLADLGARVIKVERPDVGDFARGYDRTVHGQSSYFVWLNRGKESVELDVKQADDRALLDTMIGQADVFVHNLVPGAVERLGLAADTLRATRPELIHCSISGYGPTGPYRSKKAYDLLVQCETGLVLATGAPDVPAKAGISIADIATGMYAYSGILTALYDRERSGQGASLHVAMIDALGEWMTQPAYFSHYGGEPPRRTGARHPSISPYGPHRTGDGTVFVGIQNEREWAVLCRDVLLRPDLADDPRFATNEDRVAHNDELTAIIEGVLADLDADEAVERFERAGIANARLRTPAELTRHPQLAARQRWCPVDTPGGPVEALLPPVAADGWEPVLGAVPALGQHNDAIRAEFAPRKDLPA